MATKLSLSTLSKKTIYCIFYWSFLVGQSLVKSQVGILPHPRRTYSTLIAAGLIRSKHGLHRYFIDWRKLAEVTTAVQNTQLNFK